MDKKLFIEAILKFLLGLVLVALLIFVPANTIKYFYGWLFIILLFLPMFIAGIIMFLKSPELLKHRLNAKEKESEQKKVVALSGLMFVVGFVLAGLNYRFNWILLPNGVVIIASAIFLLSYILYAEVLRENLFLLRTIDVKDNQKIVDTGLYGIIRHPMYAITIVLFLAMPLVLNSLISFIVFLVYPVIIVKRITNEEQILEAKLKGYKDYQKKVKYKLIPFIW